MSDKSAIEWTDATWNPTVGCSIVSPGCTNCYAMKVAHGLERRFGSKKYGGLTKVINGNPVWTGEVRLDESALEQPLKWKKGRRIFVNSMSDLFHESLSSESIDRVFAVMAKCQQHTFQILTKRADRMRDYMREPKRARARLLMQNVWLGVSCERQQEANERIPLLLDTPAAIRFVSAEPLLGPILLRVPSVHGGYRSALTPFDDCDDCGPDDSARHLDWVIVGGESGPGARPMQPEWARSIRDQCSERVPFFFKQWGEHVPRYHPGRVGVPEHVEMRRVGKKAAGRQLDGLEYNEFPSRDRNPKITSDASQSSPAELVP